MAAAAAQLANNIESEGRLPVTLWTKPPFLGDSPSEQGKKQLQLVSSELGKIVRHQADCKATCVDQTAPGAANHPGAPGNAATQAEHANRERAGHDLILSMTIPGTNLYTLFETPDYALGSVMWTYINGPNVIYIAPEQHACDAHKDKVRKWTWEDMPAEKKNRTDFVLQFKSYLLNHNPDMHPGYALTAAELRRIFVDGLHPELKLLGIHVLNNNAVAVQNNCVAPANIPAHMPNGGNAHPNAGDLDIDLIALYLHRQAQALFSADKLRLKGKPGINLVDEPESPVPGKGDLNLNPEFIYATFQMVKESIHDTMDDFIYYVKGRIASSDRLRTCKNCGGVGHFAYKDGKFACPTPEKSVPQSLLMNIQYPFGVQPWRFYQGRGNGKGKGKGKGKGYGGGKGKGKGGDAYWAEPDNEQEPGPSSSTDNTESGQWITDDFDGWNDGS